MKATALAMLALCLLAPVSADAYWVIVDQSGGGNYTTITEGLAAALPGDQVRVKGGTYSASTGETMPIMMRSGVTLMAHSRFDPVIIDGEGLTRCMKCVNLSSTTRIEDITLTGGFAPGWDRHGAGMWIGGFDSTQSPRINRVTFSDNDAPQGFGGGLFADATAGYVIFSDCRFTGNTAVNGGGAYVQSWNPPGFVRCVFDNNSVTGYGGGLHLAPDVRDPGEQRDLVFQFLTFSDNSAGLGSAACHTYHNVRFWNTIFAFSQSANDPIGVSNSAIVTLECCDVYGNEGGDYVGCIDGQLGVSGNVWDDPEFCGVASEPDDPYSLSVNSPCTEENYEYCGQIGARQPRCGVPYLDFNFDWLEYYIPFGEQFCDHLMLMNGGDLDVEWQLVAYEVISERGWGGPDAFGYRWGDSDKPDGPDFEWNDISGVGTPVTLGDDEAVLIPLPFEFPFYDTSWFEFALSSNGYLTFGSDWTASTNGPIPDPTQPNEFIAPFWEDLDPSQGGTIHTYYSPDAGTFTVQFTDVPIGFAGAGGEYTFQVVLYEDGTIRFYYLSMTGLTDGATIGIENPDGTIGLEIAYNEPYVHDELAVIIDLGPPAAQWVQLSLTSGTIMPGGEATCEICVDAEDMEAGIYEATLALLSNDYNEPIRLIPFTTEVFPTGVEGDTVDGMTLRGNYPNPFSPETAIAFDLPRPASASMRIYNAAGQLVRVLFDSAELAAGPHAQPWDGRDDEGRSLASGVYFCRLEVGGEALSTRMVLIR